MLGCYTGKGLAWNWSEPLGRGGQSGRVREQKQTVKVSPAYIEAGCVREIGRVGVGRGWKKSNYCVICGCLLSLSVRKNGFHDLLRVRPSSLLMLFGCISSSVAFLMRRSM